ncbi:MAG TPA: hypothetical protein VF477_08620 [Mycobacterium sp.]
MSMLINPYMFGGGPKTALEMVQAAGFTSGLQLCLDPADSASYSGSGNWLDTSGNSNNFQAGAGSPTFNGSAGGKSPSEYWTGNATANPWFEETTTQTFMQPYHENNALFTILGALYVPTLSGPGNVYLLGDITSSLSQRGFRLGLFGGTTIQFQVGNNTGTAALAVADATLSANVQVGWNVLGIAVDEAAGSYRAFINTGSSTGSATYSSPSAGVGSQPNYCGRPTSATAWRLGPVLSWNNAKSLSDYNALYAQLKARFTTLP